MGSAANNQNTTPGVRRQNEKCKTSQSTKQKRKREGGKGRGEKCRRLSPGLGRVCARAKNRAGPRESRCDGEGGVFVSNEGSNARGPRLRHGGDKGGNSSRKHGKKEKI